MNNYPLIPTVGINGIDWDKRQPKLLLFEVLCASRCMVRLSQAVALSLAGLIVKLKQLASLFEPFCCFLRQLLVNFHANCLGLTIKEKSMICQWVHKKNDHMGGSLMVSPLVPTQGSFKKKQNSGKSIKND